MHLQAGNPGWTDALPHLPDGGLVLAVDNGGMLLEAKRANARLITAYRHYFDVQEFSGNYDAAVGIWRHNFSTFIDGTYLAQYAPFVDLVLEYNEYFDQGMATNDPAEIAIRLTTATAAANVWNDEYRGKAGIPSETRLVIGNSPVGNNIPVGFARLAISTDNVLGYHPYQRASVTMWPAEVRDPGDWQYHSGRWAFMEQAWGLRPRWAFTETMPYMGSAEGWRHPTVLNGNAQLLADIFRLWLLDVAQTPAYKQGRIYGPGAWFTIGGGEAWKYYDLERAQLIALADVARELWHPGVYDMDAQLRAEIGGHAQDILDLLYWDSQPIPFVIPAQNKTLTFYTQAGQPLVPPVSRYVSWPMNVNAKSGVMLQVLDKPGTASDWWVRMADLTVP